MARLRSNSLVLAVSALALAASSAAAQIDEADRLQRCANNRERIVALDNQLRSGDNLNEEQIARARQALLAVRELSAAIGELSDTITGQYDVGSPAVRPLFESIVEAGASVNVRCMVRDAGCPGRMMRAIEQQIDKSVAALPARQAVERERMRHYANYLALGCDRAPPIAAAAAAAASASAVLELDPARPPEPSPTDANWVAVSDGSMQYRGGVLQSSYRWSMPRSIPAQGAPVQLTVSAQAGQGSGMATGIEISGPLDFVTGDGSPAEKKLPLNISAGSSDSRSMTVLLRPQRSYAPGQDVAVTVGAFWGAKVVYHYRVVRTGS